MVYKWVLVAITIAGLLGCLTFVVRYAILSKGAWFNTEAGRFMMIVYTTLGSLFSLILANQIFGLDWFGREVVTLILFTMYVVFAWWPNRLLTKAREVSRQERVDRDG
jgi:hypothetical protein